MQQAADEDRAPEAQEAVGDHAADEGREVHEGHVGAVDLAGQRRR